MARSRRGATAGEAVPGSVAEAGCVWAGDRCDKEKPLKKVEVSAGTDHLIKVCRPGAGAGASSSSSSSALDVGADVEGSSSSAAVNNNTFAVMPDTLKSGPGRIPTANMVVRDRSGGWGLPKNTDAVLVYLSRGPSAGSITRFPGSHEASELAAISVPVWGRERKVPNVRSGMAVCHVVMQVACVQGIMIAHPIADQRRRPTKIQVDGDAWLYVIENSATGGGVGRPTKRARTGGKSGFVVDDDCEEYEDLDGDASEDEQEWL